MTATPTRQPSRSSAGSTRCETRWQLDQRIPGAVALAGRPQPALDRRGSITWRSPPTSQRLANEERGDPVGEADLSVTRSRTADRLRSSRLPGPECLAERDDGASRQHLSRMFRFHRAPDSSGRCSMVAGLQRRPRHPTRPPREWWSCGGAVARGLMLDWPESVIGTVRARSWETGDDRCPAGRRRRPRARESPSARCTACRGR
jgi:hypothetical protein